MVFIFLLFWVEITALSIFIEDAGARQEDLAEELAQNKKPGIVPGFIATYQRKYLFKRDPFQTNP